MLQSLLSAANAFGFADIFQLYVLFTLFLILQSVQLHAKAVVSEASEYLFMFQYTLFFINHFILSINAQDFSVGTWRDHLPYSKFNQVVQVGNFFYASTPYSIVEFDNSNNEMYR